MADFKVITRGEVNELVPGTFTDDLNKAVLYGELSGNPAFIVNSVNQASGLNYREDQALLGADIQVRSGASILLTIGVNPVLATATTKTFTIVVDNIDVSTLGWYEVGSVGVTTCTVDNNNLSGATNFPENGEYTAKTITVAVSGTSLTGDMVTGVTSFIQGRAEVTPELSIIYNGSDVPASSGETSSFTITKDYVTINEIEVDGDARVVSSGDTGVTIEYPANTGDSRDFTVTVHGTDVYGSSHTDTCTFTQEGDDYEFRLNPSSAAPAATSTSTTVNIVSRNVDSIGVSGYAGGVSGARITGNTLIVEFPANQDTQEKEMTVTLTGVTTGGRVVPIIFPITQGAAGQIVFSLTYNGGTVDSSSGTTTDFTIGIAEATITRFTVPAGCSYKTGGTSDNPTLTFNYPKNTDENSGKTYTIVMEGTNTFGEYVSASTEVTQSADSYEFNLSPVSNPIAASASTAAFNLTGTSVSGIGYYSGQSQNINGISGLSSNSVTATGITPNSGSTDKDIVLVLSGKTNAGRTVFETGSTLQVHSRSGFGFEGGFDVNPGATSTTVEYTYKYLTGSTLTLYASNGAYFDPTHTSTSTTVNVTPNSAERTESVNVFFDANEGSVKTYTISNGAVKGEAGESFTDSVIITHKAERKITVTPTGGTTSESAGTVTFTVTWENFERSDLINLSPTNVTILSSTIVLTSESGTTAITATKTANIGPDTRDLTLEASYGSGSEKISDTGLIVQNVPAGSLSVLIYPFSTDHTIPSTAGSRQFRVSWKNIKPGKNITLVQTGVTSYTPTSIAITNSNYREGEEYVTVNYSANTSASVHDIWLSGRTEDLRGSGRSDKDFYEQTGREIPAGSISVTPDGGSLLASATTANFTVTWSNLSANTNITIVTTACTTTASTISAGSSGSGSATVKVTFSKNGTSANKTLWLKASGVDGKSVTQNDTGNYVHSKSTSKLTVERSSPSGESISWDTNSVTFVVKYTDVYDTITFTGTGGTLSTTSTTVSGSGTLYVTISNIPNNTGSSSKTIKLVGSTTGLGGESLSDNASYTQAVHKYIDFTNSQQTVASYNSGTYDGSDVSASTVFTYANLSKIDGATVTSGGTWLSVSRFTTGGTNYVYFTCDCNTGGTRSGKIRITGDNGECSDEIIITQSAGVSTSFDIDFTGGTLPSASGSTNKFTFSMDNTSLTSIAVPAGCSYTTEGTSTNPTLTVTYPANASSTTKTYTVTATTVDVYGRQITDTVTITQDAAENPVLYLNSLGLDIDNTNGAPSLVITVDFNLNIGKTYSSSYAVEVNQGQRKTVRNVVDSSGNYTFTGSEVDLKVTSFTLSLTTSLANYNIRVNFPGGDSNGIELLNYDDKTYIWSAGGNPHSLGTFTPSRNRYPESTGAEYLKITITEGI